MKSCIFATEMSLVDIILLAVALAMDCLTVSIVSGLASKSTVNCKLSTVNTKTPLTIDTVRQSIASATAKRMISIRLISVAKIHDFMQ